jgi:hypothetical protein
MTLRNEKKLKDLDVKKVRAYTARIRHGLLEQRR